MEPGTPPPERPTGQTGETGETGHTLHAFARVAVAAPVLGTFDYGVPSALRSAVRPGMRVMVPFGRRQAVGFVVEGLAAPSGPAGIDETAAGGLAIRDIARVVDDDPAIDPQLLRVLVRVADYYLAPPGEVLRAALPAGSGQRPKRRLALTDAGRAALASPLSSVADSPGLLFPELWPQAHPANAGSTAAVSARVSASVTAPVTERSLLERLAKEGPLDPERLAGETQADGAAARLAALRRRGWVTWVESAVRSLDTPTEAHAVLARVADDAELARLARAPRRHVLYQALCAASGSSLPLSHLRTIDADARARLAPLVKAGLVRLEERERSAPIGADGANPLLETPPVSTPDQEAALERLLPAVDQGSFSPFLLLGVTGSGKTEVYQRLIAHTLDQGRGALVLVPEIALTPQLTARFRARFGDRVAVLHSGLSDSRRLAEWRRLRHGAARIALGARSAVFAPVQHLGCIVVDEEHDGSFKQEDGVRYNARDVALLRGQEERAVVVLGSATPSLESYQGALGGRLTLLEMPARATAQSLPAVQVVDLRKYRPDPRSLLSAPLARAIDETLAAGEQAILFLNRRGYDTSISCLTCGEAIRCRQCSVALAHHLQRARLVCHYCGFAMAPPRVCPSCKAADLRPIGLGTEKVEEAIKQRFPGARTGRLDRDTSGGGQRLERILASMRERTLDILVGTQMVTKGHDFPGVTLVGVLLADIGLGLPDFRAAERTFQLLAQVAGRAGRSRPGRVLVQTFSPTHPSIVCAAGHDYRGFCQAELAARRDLGYPPFGRLVALRVESTDEARAQAAAEQVAELARQIVVAVGSAPVDVLGPVEAPLARLRGKSRYQVWLRSPQRTLLREVAQKLTNHHAPAGVAVAIDVDPSSTL
jgi:primosomal protein N' (replication factor Y)